jgi:hypothetical protein
MRSPNDLDDAAFGTAVSPIGTKFDQNLIATHSGVHIAWGDVDVTLNPVAYSGIPGPDEAIAVAMD